MPQVRVVLADDSPLARSAARAILAREPTFTVVGEAADGYEAVQLVREQQPDLMMMDIRMPRCDGLLATKLIKREQPAVAVVILSVSDGAIPRHVAREILREFTRPEGRRRLEDPLTPREQEVLCLVGEGLTNRRIAESLCLSENTVKNHIKSILEKVQVQNRVQLALYARDGLPRPGEANQ